jgi:hypothetical protein
VSCWSREVTKGTMFDFHSPFIMWKKSKLIFFSLPTYLWNYSFIKLFMVANGSCSVTATLVGRSVYLGLKVWFTLWTRLFFKCSICCNLMQLYMRPSYRKHSYVLWYTPKLQVRLMSASTGHWSATARVLIHDLPLLNSVQKWTDLAKIIYQLSVFIY